MTERLWQQLERHWKWVVVLAWVLLCSWFVYSRWQNALNFDLGDTDDNLRMMQVRGLLGGQDWFDLRQYRLNPPEGADIHWSRFVDLPLAGLILLLRPLVGGVDAERVAAAVAPLLPYLLLLFGVALTARRLIAPRAYLLCFVALWTAGSTNNQFMPDRIDHHGWQLALLSIAIAGVADPKRARGGATTAAATALSLAIGLELLVYLALLGAAQVLFWIDDRSQRRRLATYAATLAGGTGLSFLLFASYANRHPVCDALSPVWLSDALLGGALLFGLAYWSPPQWKARLAAAAVAGAVVALFHAFAWPHCLSRLEGVSPEVYELWLQNVREARPIYSHGWRVTALMVGIPVTGAIGWALLAWRARRDRDQLRRTVAAAVPGLAALLLLLWQTRTGPAAQMMGVVGAVALLWILGPLTQQARSSVVRVLGFVFVVLTGVGGTVPFALEVIPAKPPTEREREIGRANRLCNTLWAYRPVARQPKGLVFTFVDMGPRLITVTHHSAIAGPYHRNGEQIADVMKAFRGSAEQAHAIIASKYRADYLLTCPSSSTTTQFMAKAPNGFYAQLRAGRAPPWLEPVYLGEASPFRMWRVKR